MTAVQTPALTVAKSASAATDSAGQSITYSYLVTNTGNVTLAGGDGDQRQGDGGARLFVSLVKQR